jgi:predicted carbohydrate-binding protein with CBM5 and CBM33 domain
MIYEEYTKYVWIPSGEHILYYEWSYVDFSGLYYDWVSDSQPVTVEWRSIFDQTMNLIPECN